MMETNAFLENWKKQHASAVLVATQFYDDKINEAKKKNDTRTEEMYRSVRMQVTQSQLASV